MEYKKLDEVLWFQEGPGVRKHQYTKSGIKLINVTNLVGKKLDLSLTDKYLSVEEVKAKYSHFMCKEGDLLVASSGITYDSIPNKVSFVSKKDLPLCMNTSVIRFQSIAEDFCINYAFYFFKSNFYRNQILKLMTGIAQLNYGPSHLHKIKIPVYDFRKQQEIVSILDKINEIIDADNKQLELLEELIKSRFIEMFGDPVTNNLGWEKKKLDEIAPVNKYKGDVQNFNGKVWLLNLDMVESNTGRVINHVFVLEKEMATSTIKFDTECVLYSKLRPYLNKVVIPDLSGYATSEMISINSNNVNKYFLSSLLRHESFVNYANSTAYGAKMPRASVDGIKSFGLIYPPKSLQEKFSAFVQLIDKSKFNIQQHIDLMQELLDKKMNEYFG